MIRIMVGDCLVRLKEIPDASIDSCVCDPPYHLTSIVKRFGAPDAAPAQVGATGAYARASRGFMGQTWDGGDVAFDPETWAEVLRVLKPGAHLVAFSGTRTYHRMAVAIEDAGFEIRDQLAWTYGSGFPKSHDVAKAIDKAAGAEREILSEGRPVKRMIPGADQNKAGWKKDNGREFVPTVTAAATPEAAEWDGWGTALKPAWEPICLARKPLVGTIAGNVLAHGTGALNIDGCRIGDTVETWPTSRARPAEGGPNALYTHKLADRGAATQTVKTGDAPPGRWPANIIHDGSPEVMAGFPDTASGVPGTRRKAHETGSMAGTLGMLDRPETGFGDSGSAARFFYTAKTDAAERHAGCHDMEKGNSHPTVKPVDLMRWLCRLVTPKGGTVLDPFMGSGSTMIAADAEQMNGIGCELSPEYAEIAERRIRASAGLFADVTVLR